MRLCLLPVVQLSLLFSLPALGQQAPAGPAEAPATAAPPSVAPADGQSETPPAPTDPSAQAGAEAAAEGGPTDAPSTETPAEDAEAPADATDQAPAAAPSEAAVDPSKRLLLLGLADKGVGEELAALLNTQLSEQAAKSFVGEVVSRAQLKEMLDEAAVAAVDGCDAEACMTDLGQKVDAGRVIAGTASMAGADVLMTLLVIEAGTGKLLSSDQVKAPNEPEMVAYAMRNLTAIALTGRAADARVPVRISVDADEPGTRITVDGRDEGEAPKTVLMLPGEHKIVATLPGYEPTTQVVNVEEAKPMDITISLYWERFPLWPVAATLGVASFLTVSTGAALFLIGWYNYDGFGVIGAPFGNGHSYQGHTPATSATLISTSQNVLLWAWAGTLVASAGVAIGVAALAFEVGDLSLLAIQAGQYNE